MIKAIIFDCFGVIRVDAFDAVYKHFGGDVVKDHEYIMEIIQGSNEGKLSSAEVLSKHLGTTPEQWRREVEAGSTLNYDVLDYILELRKKYKVGLLSNVGKGRFAQLFEPGFLDKYFDVIIASGDVGFAKPEARAYEVTAEKLGVRVDECVFIDDRQLYVDGAIAVGMPAFVYLSVDKLKTDLGAILAV